MLNCLCYTFYGYSGHKDVSNEGRKKTSQGAENQLTTESVTSFMEPQNKRGEKTDRDT